MVHAFRRSNGNSSAWRIYALLSRSFIDRAYFMDLLDVHAKFGPNRTKTFRDITNYVYVWLAALSAPPRIKTLIFHIFFNIRRRRSIISSKQHEIFQKRDLCRLKLCNMASSSKCFLCSLNRAPGDHFGFLQYWSYAISRKIVILWILTGNQNQAFKVQNYEFSRYSCLFPIMMCL